MTPIKPLPKPKEDGCPWCGVDVVGCLDASLNSDIATARDMKACPSCAMPIKLVVIEEDALCPHCGQDMDGGEVLFRVDPCRTAADLAYMEYVGIGEGDVPPLQGGAE